MFTVFLEMFFYKLYVITVVVSILSMFSSLLNHIQSVMRNNCPIYTMSKVILMKNPNVYLKWTLQNFFGITRNIMCMTLLEDLNLIKTCLLHALPKKHVFHNFPVILMLWHENYWKIDVELPRSERLMCKYI